MAGSARPVANARGPPAPRARRVGPPAPATAAIASTAIASRARRITVAIKDRGIEGRPTVAAVSANGAAAPAAVASHNAGSVDAAPPVPELFRTRPAVAPGGTPRPPGRSRT